MTWYNFIREKCITYRGKPHVKEEKGMLDFIQQTDWAILHGIQNSLRCSFMDFVMPKITTLGNGGAIWITLAVCLMISRKYRRYGFVMLSALAVGALIGNICLKPLVARARPCWIESVSLLIRNPKDYSFPSGHTLSSVIGAVVLIAADRKFGWFAIPLAALIAFSRLYLYVHFPSDVLTAAVMGVIIGLAMIILAKKILFPKWEKGWNIRR